MKPQYKVPSMKEVAKVKGTNGYKMVSTFSGCGGSCLGFEMAGFDVVFASEFVEEARKVYAINHPSVPIDERDIRNLSPEDILKATGLKIGELDVLEGSPPCASFSTAGKREKGWGKIKEYSDTQQRSDDLFFEYARILKGLQPKLFVAENVAGLIRGSAKGYFKQIIRELKSCGYRVEAKVLNAMWLGVPQMRSRLIFIGVREDLDIPHLWPEPFPYKYSIRDACPWITNDHAITKANFGKNEGNGFIKHKMNEPAGTVTTRDIGGKSQMILIKDSSASVGDEDWFDHLKSLGHPECDEVEYHFCGIEQFAIGREWLRIKQGQASKKYFNLVRSDAEKPSGAITASSGTISLAGIAHPSEARKFTIPELKRICAFPDDFILTGAYQKRWERLGRSVPPLMMKSIAMKLEEMLNGINNG
jgi:DNA (cytosine-5)-methyltransferase 1